MLSFLAITLISNVDFSIGIFHNNGIIENIKRGL